MERRRKLALETLGANENHGNEILGFILSSFILDLLLKKLTT